jgi:hypothetical protein
MKYKGVAAMMIAVIAMLLAAGCTSSPEQTSCPISPAKEAANQSENVTAPIKLTEGDDQAVPCAEINGKQEGK